MIHNIPLRDVQQDPSGNWWDKNRMSAVNDWKVFNPPACSAATQCSKAIHYLIPDLIMEKDLRAKGSVSMCIAFDNVKHAHRLIWVGAFILIIVSHAQILLFEAILGMPRCCKYIINLLLAASVH